MPICYLVGAGLALFVWGIPGVQVAAASDLSAAFEAVGRAFEQGGGPPVRFSFGSSTSTQHRSIRCSSH